MRSYTNKCHKRSLESDIPLSKQLVNNSGHFEQPKAKYRENNNKYPTP